MARAILLRNARLLDAASGPRADDRQPAVHQEPGEAALMLPYIITGVVALIVTLYLFAALLFPERF
jgi:K+-transporting ATPase KdpF subunit